MPWASRALVRLVTDLSRLAPWAARSCAIGSNAEAPAGSIPGQVLEQLLTLVVGEVSKRRRADRTRSRLVQAVSRPVERWALVARSPAALGPWRPDNGATRGVTNPIPLHLGGPLAQWQSRGLLILVSW